MVKEDRMVEGIPITTATKIGQTPGKAAKMRSTHRMTIDETGKNLGKEEKAEAVLIFKRSTTETKNIPLKVLNRQLCPAKLQVSPVQILIKLTVQM
jgi:hypothetical protein